MPKRFEAGKTAEALGIDTSKKFVAMDAIGSLEAGDIVRFEYASEWQQQERMGTFVRLTDLRVFSLFWYQLAYADEPEELLGFDQGTAEGDEPVALYGKRHKDGTVEVTRSIEGLPLSSQEPYQPRVGDRVALEGEVVEIEEERRLIVKLQPNAGEIYVYPKQVENGVLKLLSRKPTRKLTKEEAERLLCEKLNEQVTIE